MSETVTQRRRRIVALSAAFVVAAVVATTIALLLGGNRDFDYHDPFDDLRGGGEPGAGTVVVGAPDADRQVTRFLAFVARDVQAYWAREFGHHGRRFVPAQLVVFRRSVRSGCGLASSATGPFYCALDRRVYLDVGFFRQLAAEFRAPGDFAQAYVIAHEIGHHVQNVSGVMAQVSQAVAAGVLEPREGSIGVELQADCLAGVWGHSTYERGMLQRGDLEEGLRAAAAVGDDRIQARTTGRVDPETWTHGSSEQRLAWFLRGFESGDASACDTFSA
jgi:uncharacterized protein